MIDQAIFEDLQAKIDEDTETREACRSTQALLSRAHSTPSSRLSDTVRAVETSIRDEAETISQLSSEASKHPYYKYNGSWTYHMQKVSFAVIFCGWLGGFSGNAELSDLKQGRLLTIEEVGGILQVPVNLKETDAFHLTIEEYLLSLITLIEELARLAVNSVTLGDHERPLAISRFVKDIHEGFQLLNLKNDTLRKRSDGIKYNLKKVEDVVYDLSLRNLIPTSGQNEGGEGLEI
ncbi:MAG: hypothetical protein M1833_001354 [Piccolia ochrophora]|nr:MAG: hypothetical protein M1833_001354 [Piccolia ochrophora]